MNLAPLQTNGPALGHVSVRISKKKQSTNLAFIPSILTPHITEVLPNTVLIEADLENQRSKKLRELYVIYRVLLKLVVKLVLRKWFNLSVVFCLASWLVFSPSTLSAKPKRSSRSAVLKRDIKKISKDFSGLVSEIRRLSKSYASSPEEDYWYDDPEPIDPTAEIKNAINEAWVEIKESALLVQGASYSLSAGVSQNVLLPESQSLVSGISSAMSSLIYYRGRELVRRTTSYQIRLADKAISSYSALLARAADSCRISTGALAPHLSQAFSNNEPSILLLKGGGLPDPIQILSTSEFALLAEVSALRNKVSNTRVLLERLRVLSLNSATSASFRQVLNPQKAHLYLDGQMEILIDLYNRFGGSELRIAAPSLIDLLTAIDASASQLQVLGDEVIASGFQNLSDEASEATDLLGYANFLSTIQGWCDSVSGEAQFLASISTLIQNAARDVALSALGQIQKMQVLNANISSLLAAHSPGAGHLDELAEVHFEHISNAASLLEYIYELFQMLEVGPPDPGGDKDYEFEWPEEEQLEDSNPESIVSEMLSAVFESMLELKNGKKLVPCFFKVSNEAIVELKTKAISKCLFKRVKHRSLKSKDLSRAHEFIEETKNSLSESM